MPRCKSCFMLSRLYAGIGNVTNEWSHTSIPPYAFIACTVTTSCYFTLIPCSYQRFGGKYCLRCQGLTSEWSPRLFRKFRRHLPNCSAVWLRISQSINLRDWCNTVTWPTHRPSVWVIIVEQAESDKCDWFDVLFADIAMDWSDHALWWPTRNTWLTRTRSTLDQYGVQADALLHFTPMHKTLRVQLPDLRYLDCRVNFSIKTFNAVVNLCKELGKKCSHFQEPCWNRF